MDPASSPGHRSAVAAATLAAGALVAQQVAGKATRDALFLSSFHASSLPVVMIASALVSSVAVLAFSAALQRRAPARVVPLVLGAGTVLLLAEWGLCLVQPRLAAIAVYLHMAAFGATVVSGFWSMVGERFDPHTARRAMGGIGLGASLGGVAGGLLAWSAAGLVPLPAMLAVMAALNVVCLLALGRLQASTAEGKGSGRGRDAEASGPLAGLRLMSEVPYLRDLALMVALGAATETLLDYLLSSRAAATFPPGPALMSFFALFHTGVGLLALGLQVTLTRAALQGLGLAGTVALRPAAVAVCALLGLVDPRLWSALLARGAHGVLHNSLFRSGYELLFTPLPERRKRPTKTLVDVGCDKAGAVLGGLVTLTVVAAFGGRGGRVLFALAVVGGVSALLLSRRLQRGYVRALEESLRSGVVRLELGDVLDATTYMTLARSRLRPDSPAGVTPGSLHAHIPAPAEVSVVEAIAALHSGEAEEIRRVLSRAQALEPILVGHLIPLLAHNDVFLDVLRPLRRAAPRATGQLLDALLDPEQVAAVRRRIPRVLRGSPTQRAVDGLLQGLADPLFEVRRQCGLSLARILEREPGLAVARSAVFAAILRELEHGAASWVDEAEGGGTDEGTPEARFQSPAARGLAHLFALLSLTAEREPLQLAQWALGGDDAVLRGTALEYLENILPDDVRRGLFAHLGAQARAAKGARSQDEVKRELLRSGNTLALARAAAVRKDPER